MILHRRHYSSKNFAEIRGIVRRAAAPSKENEVGKLLQTWNKPLKIGHFSDFIGTLSANSCLLKQFCM
jgi:hypothetical protein